MNPVLEIFSQGEEIVTGQTVDTNAAWLAQQTVPLGFRVTRHTAVGDQLDDLVGLLKEIATRADCCICTGGLGPTIDDLTTAAVATAFDLPLAFDDSAFAHIQQFFLRRNRTMPEANRKQAMLPHGAVRLDNDVGTAPGFTLQQQRCRFFFLPGVPSEMKPMFAEHIRPTLSRLFALQASTLVSIKTFGIGESDIQQRIDTRAIPESVQLGFRASLSEVQTKLLFPPGYDRSAMAALTERIGALLGDAVFAVDGLDTDAGGDLVATLDRLMRTGGHTLAVVETVSQGLIASLCIGSAWLLQSCFEPSPAKLRQKFAPASPADDWPTAVAETIRNTSGADFVLLQLYDGDFEHLQDKDSLTELHTVLLTTERSYVVNHAVAGAIKRKQGQAALSALDVVRRYLQFGRV